MIQVGDPFMIGVTFDQPGLFVAARIFNTSGPVTGWMAMNNFDGNSYNLAYTLNAIGAYSIKKVAFTDGTFTVRNLNEPEADDAIQVADISGGGGGGGMIAGGGIVGLVGNDDNSIQGG